jgi:hypothetical protein
MQTVREVFDEIETNRIKTNGSGIEPERKKLASI